MHPEESPIARRETGFLLKESNSRSAKQQFTKRIPTLQSAKGFSFLKKIESRQAKGQNFRSKMVSRSAKGRN